MPTAFRRIVTLLFLLGLSSLQLVPAFPSGQGQAEAATKDRQRGTTGQAKRSQNAPVSIAPTAMLPAMIENLRSSVSPDSTRLVLDLDRKVKIRKPTGSSGDEIVIKIPNATLSPKAQRKIAAGSLPQPFTIAQASEHSVSVSLPSGSYETYRMLTLANPPRLVIDVVPSNTRSTPQESSPSVEQTVPSDTPAPAPTPPQPVPPPTKSFKTIVIDPGHGGKDPGAHGKHGTLEKDITLKVALKLRYLLSKQPGVRVLMTRDRDVFVELEDRAKFANGNGADLFVSIHVNSHPQRSVRGIEIYHFGEAKDQRALEVAARENGTPLNNTGVGWEYLVADLLAAKKIEESLDLAWNTKEAMITHLNGHYALVDHGVKTAPFYVLRFTSMPSILAEIAYISNSTEENLLRNNTFLTRVAESVLEGVLSYLNSANQPGR